MGKWDSLPRPFGRGLIEAARVSWFGTRGARLPRPFGRGLIEARLLSAGAE